jgi:hypothetical protein
MLAWLAAALFFIAALISGHAINASSPWFQPVTLIAAGLCCMVLAGALPSPWGRKP